ncbi:MAG TPA: nitrite reductase, partial [Chryseosolibacter sp.]
DGIISDKIIKIPSRRGPEALRILLNDYEANAHEGEYYHSYFQRLGRNHFYALLKPLGDVTRTAPVEYIDWGHDKNFVLHTAVGECAGVIIDLVSTLLYETEEKLAWAKEAFEKHLYADAIYHSYSAFINTSKALLLTKEIKPSTQIQTLNDFQQHFIDSGLFPFDGSFKEYVLRINKNEPGETFASAFIADAEAFMEKAFAFKNLEKVTV